MNKKFTLIAKNKETYFIKRLIEEVGHDLPCFDPWSDVDFPKADTYLVRTTGVYGSDLDLLILKGVGAKKVVNSLAGLSIFRTKSHQYKWLDEQNFPVLPWLVLKGADPLTVEKFFRLYPEAVVKPLCGQGGWGVEGVNWENFRQWKKKKGTDEDYLIQPFVKDSPELRYFFIKGKASVVLERKSKSGIAANFQKGGNAQLSKLPAGTESMVYDLVEKSGLHYGAIDIIYQHGRPQILEVNSVPGFEQVEQISGLNLVRELLDSL